MEEINGHLHSMQVLHWWEKIVEICRKEGYDKNLQLKGYIVAFEHDVRDLIKRTRELEREVSNITQEVEQLRVQLAGCSVAALGGKDDLQPGDYGWSVPYGDVVALRKRTEELEAENVRLKAIAEAANELLEVATLRGDNDLPHPTNDPKLWSARMQDAWNMLEAALAALEEGKN